MLMHLARRADWDAAQDRGLYPWSTVGLTAQEVGFVHCSESLAQVAEVYERSYTHLGASLVLLHIDESSLADHGIEVVREPANDAGGELFPHLYGGPLPLAAVTEVTPYPRAAEGV